MIGEVDFSNKLVFGEDKELLSHPKLSYTSLVGGKENHADAFYYVQIKSIMVLEGKWLTYQRRLGIYHQKVLEALSHLGWFRLLGW